MASTGAFLTMCSTGWVLAVLCLWHSAGVLHALPAAAQPMAAQNFTALQNGKLDMAGEALVVIFRQVLWLTSCCQLGPDRTSGHGRL